MLSQPDTSRSSPRHSVTWGVALLCLVLLAGTPGYAQPPAPQAAKQAQATRTAPGGPSWSSLTPAQRSALAPLEKDWGGIDAARKQKWLTIAAKMPAMPPDEQQRIQARMHEWATLSPQERGQTRLRYQEARQVTPAERQERWQAYQALPPEKRQELVTRAQPQAKAASAALPAKASGRSARDATPVAKNNIVPNPASIAGKPKAVAPSVVQARPGATTTLISRRPSPPPHQQTGMPKIAATPDFVDRNTLLPQKGPQGAAMQAGIPASAPHP